MDKAIIYTHDVGKVLPMQLSKWPRWSLGVRAANFIFIGGQPGVDNQGTVIGAGDIRVQARAALDNVRKIVEGGGGHFSDVVKLRAFLHYGEDLSGLVETVREYFERYRAGVADPAVSYVVSPVTATREAGQLLVEIEVFAATEHRAVRSVDLFGGFAEDFSSARYSHACRVGNLTFTSGQLPVDRDGRLLHEDAAEQTAQALANLERALDAAGNSPGDIVKLTTFVDRPDDFPAIRDVRAAFIRRHFPDGRYPAATTIATPIGLAGARVEVEAVAAVGEKTIVESDRTYRSLPGQDPYSQAVKVTIESAEGSWLRRFTWPSYPEDVDRSRIGLELEQPHELGHLVFLSSQAPFDAAGDLVGEGDIAVQARQVFANLESIAEACGGKLSDIVQVDFYLESAQYYEDFNEARVRACEQGYPDKNWFAGSGISGRSLVPGALFEMEAIASIASAFGPPGVMSHARGRF